MKGKDFEYQDYHDPDYLVALEKKQEESPEKARGTLIELVRQWIKANVIEITENVIDIDTAR